MSSTPHGAHLRWERTFAQTQRNFDACASLEPERSARGLSMRRLCKKKKKVGTAAQPRMLDAGCEAAECSAPAEHSCMGFIVGQRCESGDGVFPLDPLIGAVGGWLAVRPRGGALIASDLITLSVVLRTGSRQRNDRLLRQGVGDGRCPDPKPRHSVYSH